MKTTSICNCFWVNSNKHKSRSPFQIRKTFKNSQQKLWPVLIALRRIGDYYGISKEYCKYYTPLIIVVKGLFINMKYVKIQLNEIIYTYSNCEN